MVRRKLVALNDPASVADNDYLQYDAASDTFTSTASAGGVTDHGALTGLGDDDHTQYLKERASGGVESEVPVHRHQSVGTGGTVDHGVLTGLSDDDHPQYIHGDAFIAKGDILGGTGTGTYANTPVGLDGNFLVADSGESEGLIWRDIADADIPSAIARDSEVTSAISTHASDASAHHTKYLDSEAIAAVEGEATLDLTGAVSLTLGDLTLTAGDIVMTAGNVSFGGVGLIDQASWLGLDVTGSAANYAGISFEKTNTGTTAVTDNDYIAGLDFYGYDGTSSVYDAGIYARVDGTVSASDVPMELEFWAGNAVRSHLLPGGTWNHLGNMDVGAGLDVTGDITVTGTVDGVDVAAHAADASAHAVASGSSFPGSPSTGDRYIRTDFRDGDLVWFWDGTYWLTEQVFYFHFKHEGAAGTGSATRYQVLPLDCDVYVTEADIMRRVNSAAESVTVRLREQRYDNTAADLLSSAVAPGTANYWHRTNHTVNTLLASSAGNTGSTPALLRWEKNSTTAVSLADGTAHYRLRLT